MEETVDLGDAVEAETHTKVPTVDASKYGGEGSGIVPPRIS